MTPGLVLCEAGALRNLRFRSTILSPLAILYFFSSNFKNRQTRKITCVTPGPLLSSQTKIFHIRTGDPAEKEKHLIQGCRLLNPSLILTPETGQAATIPLLLPIHYNSTTISMKYLLLALCVFTSSVLFAQQPTHHIGLRISPLNPDDSLLIAMSFPREEPIIIVVKQGDPIQFFPMGYKNGDTVLLSEWIWSTRECKFGPNGADRMMLVFQDSDIIVDCNCGTTTPSSVETYRYTVRLNPSAKQGTYMFKAATLSNPVPQQLKVDVTSTGVHAEPSAKYFKKGDTVIIKQLSGPEAVLFTNNRLVVNNSDLLFTVKDANTGGQAGKSKVSGTYTAPPGTKITVQMNGRNDIVLTAPAYSSTGSNSIGFSFKESLSDGAAYAVSVKAQPANCKCSVQPVAAGTTPVDSLQLNILCSPAVELVSRSTNNKLFNTFYETSSPVVGGKGNEEGRYVAFVSSGAGLDGSTGKFRQVYLRDMKSGETKMISRSPSGDEGNGNSFAPAISADGKSVAFESYANNLSAADNNNGVRDVFVWKAGAGVSLVSKGSGGSGNGESFEPTISGDGSVIAFSSYASNLAQGVDGVSMVNVYVVDALGPAQLITRDYRTKKAVGGSAPSIAEAGDKIIFYSVANTLVENDKKNLWGIFLWQRGMVDLKKVSHTASGGDRDQGTESASRVVYASISGDGNYVVFASTASNMVDGDTNKWQDIFFSNINGGSVQRLSVGPGNLEGDGDSPIEQGGRIGISYDGTWVSFNTNASNLGLAKGNIILQNTKTGKIIPVTNSIYNSSGRPLVSRTGAYVVAGCSEKLDTRYVSSGVFEFFTGGR